LATSTRN